jgi:hypothetical protein
MIDRFHDRIRAIIEAHGQMLMRVHPDATDPPGTLPFVYTIGNHQHRLPELLVVGFDGTGFEAQVLNLLGAMQRQRRAGFHDGELVSLSGPLPVRIIDAGAAGRSEFAVQVGVYYGTDEFDVRQIVLPDPNGRWPGDPQCETPFSRQPLLSGGGSVARN